MAQAKKNPPKRSARRVGVCGTATRRWRRCNSRIRASWRLLRQQQVQLRGRQRRRPQVLRQRVLQHQPGRRQGQQQRQPVRRRVRQQERLQRRVRVRVPALLPFCHRRPG